MITDLLAKSSFLLAAKWKCEREDLVFAWSREVFNQILAEVPPGTIRRSPYTGKIEDNGRFNGCKYKVVNSLSPKEVKVYAFGHEIAVITVDHSSFPSLSVST